MKKYIALFALFCTMLSCSTDVNQDKFHLELLPVDSAVLPAQFKKDSIYELPISYIRPSNCHIFDGFYYEKDLNKRTIAIQTSVLEHSGCGPAPVSRLTEILNFKPTTESSYVFRLWKGKDASGQDVFEETEIPVVP